VAPAPTPAPEHHYVESTETWLDRYGLGFSIGGGLDDFAGSTARDTTDLGGGWTARATFGTRSYVAFEAAYIGSANSVNALGLQSDALLVGNGAQGDVRINVLPHFVAQPFIYGGIAWRHYDITNSSVNTSDIADHDDVAEFPVGVGLAGYIGGFMADVRGEYRWSAYEDLMPSLTTSGSEASLDRWGVTGNLGFSY
jgi:hypothetical protein